MSDVKIVIDASTNNIKSTFSNVAVSLNKLEAEARQTNEALKESSNGLAAKWRDASVSLASTFSLINSGIDKLKKGMAMIGEGADLSEAQLNFRAYAASINQDSDTIVAAVRKATKNQVSDADIMKSATRALRLGVTTDLTQLAKLYEIADTKGDMFGQSLEDTFRQITDAIAKGNGRALIELGVLPEKFGKAGNAAELFKKQGELLNAVLDQSGRDMEALAPVGDTLSDKLNQLNAGVGNVADSLKMMGADVFAPTVDWLNNSMMPALKDSIDYWREWLGLLEISRDIYAKFGPAGEIASKMESMSTLKNDLRDLIRLRADLENQKMSDDGNGMLSGIIETRLGAVRSDIEQKKGELKGYEKEYQLLLDKIKNTEKTPPAVPGSGGNPTGGTGGIVDGTNEQLKKFREEVEKTQQAVIDSFGGKAVNSFKDANHLLLNMTAAAGGFAVGLKNGTTEAGRMLEEIAKIEGKTAQFNENFQSMLRNRGYNSASDLRGLTPDTAMMGMMDFMSGGIFTAKGGSAGTKAAIDDIKEPLSKTIAEAVQAGFANADFSNLSMTLGSILTSVLSKSIAQSNPVMDAGGAINWGNLGINLGVSAVTSVLTKSGRFFGGREEHGKEAIGQVSTLINNLTKAYDDSYLSEIYSVYAPQDRKNAIEAARRKARGASASYTWSDSGNGVWSDKTRTYALVDNGAGDALRAIEEAVKAVVTISKNRESELKLEAAKGYEYKVLKEQVSAYETALQKLYYGPSSYSDSATDRTEATRTVQTELAQMIRELASATAERNTNISSSYMQYAPWLTMSGTRDQQYDAWSQLQTSYYDRDINTGLLNIVQESGKKKFDLQALQITDPEAYQEEYQAYLDRQIESFEEVMERQSEIFTDLSKSYEERSAALSAYEAAQESYYQAKLDALAAEQAAEEAVKRKQQEADLLKAERMEAALSLVGEVSQRGDRIVILQGGDSTAALKELLEKFQDDPSVAAILQAAITDSENKARWGN